MSSLPIPSLVEGFPPGDHNFAFLANVGGLNGPTELRLTEEHVLRRAKLDEVVVIKEALTSLAPRSQLLPAHALWETRRFSPTGLLESRPAEEWRYFVLEHRVPQPESETLQLALDIASSEIEVALQFHLFPSPAPRIRSVSYFPTRLYHWLDHAESDTARFITVDQALGTEIHDLYAKLKRHADASPEFTALAGQFAQLKALPRHSPLVLLGYFALLESLLTHKPVPTDPYDSITRQIKRKLFLLDKRWSRRLDYASFKSRDHDAIWTAMYDLRSTIAHGGTPNFASGKSEKLQSLAAASELVRQATKQVFAHYLREPDLVADLRDC